MQRLIRGETLEAAGSKNSILSVYSELCVLLAADWFPAALEGRDPWCVLIPVLAARFLLRVGRGDREEGRHSVNHELARFALTVGVRGAGKLLPLQAMPA